MRSVGNGQAPEPSRLDHTVAESADAWLRDPADPGAYARLVEAVLARRAAREGRDPERLPMRLPGLVATSEGMTDPDEELLAGRPPVEAVGDVLEGDARAVLERLRRG